MILLNNLKPHSETIANIKEHLDEEFSVSIKITKEQIRSFVDLTKDAHSIHYDDIRSKESILSDKTEGRIIVPGFLLLSLCVDKKIIFETLAKDEPHEVINLGLNDVKFLSPVYNDLNLEYRFVIRNVKDLEIKGKKSAKLDWDIMVFKIEKENRTLCMKATWSVSYTALK